ncbi:MAG: TonB-dependent siderophore receptor [Leptolyngbya sp. SIO1E4]|nr:TonB-dependent siderophore receptor [Leptolyngbya sp. SIO1E4]
MDKGLQGWNLVAIATVISGQAFGIEAVQAGELVTDPQIEPGTGTRAPAIEHGETPIPQPIYPSTQPATTVTEWMAQIEASLVQITNVRLEDTEAGLQVILETADGELVTPTTTVSGNALIAEIPNAVLTLPDGEEFQQFEPAGGIALVQVTELPNNRVQVVITGTEAAPTAAISTTAAGLTLGLTPGVAQTGTADEPLRVVVTGEEGSRYFEPNTATATRTDTPLRDIPQSIQVVPREVLEDQQVITLGDALRNVSGVVRREQIFTGELFVVRGFTGATTLRDGFRLNDGGREGFLELSNLETIEVLKGPASILTGSVQPGGVINLVSKQPLSEPFYDLELRAGNRGLISPRIDLSGPLTADGRLRYRLNALVRREESFRGYDTDIERRFVAPTVSWQIGDRTDLTVYLEYLDAERPGDLGLIALGDEVADVPNDLVVGELDDIAREETLRVAYQFEHRFSDRWTLRNGFSFFRSDASAVNTSAISVLDETTGDVSLISTFDSGIQRTFDLQTNVVGEFNTGPIEHKVLLGVDLFRNVLDGSEIRADFFSPIILNVFDPVYGTVPRPDREDTPISLLQDIREDGLGVYLQDQVTLLDNLKLLLGFRYDTIEQEVTNDPTSFNPTSSESTINEDAFTPRVGVVYQPIEAVSLYGSYSTSFSPNTATTVDGELLDPERGEQFEIGARAELLEGRLVANLAFFDITKENVATTDPDNLGSSVATGEQRSRGIELDVAGEILPGWNIIANYAYTDADITSDNRGNEGNRLRGVPEHNFNLWTTYTLQQGSLEGLGFGLGFNYVSERFGDTANTFTADGYFLTNAAVSYRRDNWRAALNIRNLFDVDYIESAGRTRRVGIGPGEPFTLIGSFAIEF